MMILDNRLASGDRACPRQPRNTFRVSFRRESYHPVMK